MKQQGAGRFLALVATSAAMLAAGAFLGASAGRRRRATAAPDSVKDPDLDLADRPVARAALAEAMETGRRLEQLSGAVAGLETRMAAIEDAAGSRIEAVWQRVLGLERRLEEARGDRLPVADIGALVSQAEARIEPRLAGLGARVDQHDAAIRELETHASQTEANLQRLITAVEKLTDQISRALPSGRMEPQNATAAAAPEAVEASPEAAAPDRPERSGPIRWRSAALVIAATLGLLAAVQQGEPRLTQAAASVVTVDDLLETAIESMTRLAERQPESLGWKFELARLHELREDWPEAERWYRGVLEQDPHNSRALNAVADLWGSRRP